MIRIVIAMTEVEGVMTRIVGVEIDIETIVNVKVEIGTGMIIDLRTIYFELIVELLLLSIYLNKRCLYTLSCYSIKSSTCFYLLRALSLNLV